MAELQIDQSNLPRVQEVCQSFAVLEDGVLAHNLQEQEIEQYYCSNVQKNQLVQNDIRVAKRLQDEEERRCRALLWQESRQLEEEEDDDDYESARLIREEVRRRAQEVRRRERDDQEMAKQMQEEEELMMRRAREEERHRGASLPPKKKQTSLDLGDLQQVLHDEELARKLHEQENNLLARTSRRPSRGRYPEGDFRVAQVAQDEEIAHYMQKQEMESNRMSRPLEEPTSWGEHRHHRPDRQVESEGLPSHVEDSSLASPVSTLGQSPPIQNIAEELDPTFRAKRQGADILQTEQSGGTCQWLPGPRRLLEEPAFIPPTKRQKDKAKEKKEKCKQQ